MYMYDFTSLLCRYTPPLFFLRVLAPLLLSILCTLKPEGFAALAKPRHLIFYVRTKRNVYQFLNLNKIPSSG